LILNPENKKKKILIASATGEIFSLYPQVLKLLHWWLRSEL